MGGPTSAEVVSPHADDMVAEGLALVALHEQIVVKTPFSAAGLEAAARLTPWASGST